MSRIRYSRLVGTRNLVLGIHASRVQVLVSASAVGYYGDRGEEELTETSQPGADFLARLCVEWEEEALLSGVRTVVLRTGMVLGPGGALQKMLGPFRMGLGGKIGSGRQWMSWIHRDDLVDLYLLALLEPKMSGPIIAASPAPERNGEFTRLLGRVVDRPAFLRISKWALRLAYGRIASVLVSSQKCQPRRALEAGFNFHYPVLEGALRDTVSSLLVRLPRAA